MELLNVVLGLLLLTLGRKLFWLFVGIVGFLTGVNLAAQYLADQPQWVIVVIGLVVGMLGAGIAMVLQRLAVGLAGFLAGGNFAVSAVAFMGFQERFPDWLPFLLGGVIGGLLLFLLFDWALIIISSLAGAALVAQGLPIDQTFQLVVFLALAAFGVFVQGGVLRREEAQAMA